jgi:hypothetical protein
MRHDEHISDQDLLLALDGELSSRRNAEVQDHLTACWPCRARRSEIEAAIEDFVRVNLASPLPPVKGPRARLKAHLAELAVADRPRRWLTLAYAGFGIVVALLAVILLQPRRVAARVTPDPSLTPGATLFLTSDQVCAGRDTVHFIPASVAGQVFAEYGIAHPTPRTYEVDYLISPELGGADDVRNVWPQSYSAVWNAHVKDALEDRLHSLVCAGKLDLATAQHDISRDWVSAYKKYFHTDRPLPDHLSFTKDRPWE